MPPTGSTLPRGVSLIGSSRNHGPSLVLRLSLSVSRSLAFPRSTLLFPLAFPCMPSFMDALWRRSFLCSSLL
jgi:hypothetical protein